VADLYRYSFQDKIPFKITLNGAGQDLTLSGGLLGPDVKLYKIVADTITDVGLECSPANSLLLPGLYLWQPQLQSHTEDKRIVLYIKDSTGAGRFDENMLVFTMGGNANAGLNGT